LDWLTPYRYTNIPLSGKPTRTPDTRCKTEMEQYKGEAVLDQRCSEQNELETVLGAQGSSNRMAFQPYDIHCVFIQQLSSQFYRTASNDYVWAYHLLSCLILQVS
jgi:hypothetical protein